MERICTGAPGEVKEPSEIIVILGSNATPLFDWGRYYEKDGRTLMPVSVQAHHSFADGVHIGKFADGLQKYMEVY